MEEKDYLFGKTYTCPACGEKFKNLTVRTGKVRTIGSDMDLRPINEGVDAVKYEVVMCGECGYAAVARFLEKPLTSVQRKAIEDKITIKCKPRPEKDAYSYEDVLERYKMAILSTVAKMGPASEMAYTCLKVSWMLRGWRQGLADSETARKQKLEAQEREFQKKALEGFVTANTKEEFPICGMDENTLDYLTAVLYMKFEQYDKSSKLISRILSSHSASSRLKDRARDVKDELATYMKG